MGLEVPGGRELKLGGEAFKSHITALPPHRVSPQERKSSFSSKLAFLPPAQRLALPVTNSPQGAGRARLGLGGCRTDPGALRVGVRDAQWPGVSLDPP